MPRSSAGFTIVELTVTIVFLGFAAAGLSSLFISIDHIEQQTAYMASANRAAQTEVESLRNSNYNQLTAGQTIDFTDQLPSTLPNGSGSVAVSEPLAGIKRVDVTVQYGVSNQHKVTLSSLIGVIGITQ